MPSGEDNSTVAAESAHAAGAARCAILRESAEFEGDRSTRHIHAAAGTGAAVAPDSAAGAGSAVNLSAAIATGTSGTTPPSIAAAEKRGRAVEATASSAA
jgi:hypothetical protein